MHQTRKAAARARGCKVNPFETPNPTLAEVTNSKNRVALAKEMARKGRRVGLIAERCGMTESEVLDLIDGKGPDQRTEYLRALPTMLLWAVQRLLDAGHRVFVGRQGVVLVDGRRLDHDSVLQLAVMAVPTSRAGDQHA